MSQTILVTGGTRGLGRAVVEQALAGGAQVAFTYLRDRDGAEELANEHPGRAFAYPFDLLETAGAEDLVAAVERDLGPITGLVNNAGTITRGLLALTSDEGWARVVEANLGGAFRCCRAVLPSMVTRRSGAIVNVSSLSAFHGLAGQAAYAASKAGLIGLTRALAREVGKRGVRVNAVAPGFLATEMTADLDAEAVAALRAHECLSAGVELGSVAETICFLLSPGARSVTGQCWIVDAGTSA